MSNYKAVINMTAFHKSEITSMEIDVKMEEGIFIPIKYNNLHRLRGKKGLFTTFTVIEKAANPFNQSHGLVQFLPKDKWKFLKDAGFTYHWMGYLEQFRYTIKKKKKGFSFDEAWDNEK